MMKKYNSRFSKENYKNRFTVFLLTLLLHISLSAQSRINETHSSLNSSSLGFFENKGQIIDQNNLSDPNLKFLLCRQGMNVQLRRNGFSYDTYSDEKTIEAAGDNKVDYNGKFVRNEKSIRNYHRVDIDLLDCNPDCEILAYDTSIAYFNYFTMGTSRLGATNVHYYQNVIYKNIYPHIDLEFSASIAQGENKYGFKYNFIIHPPGKISDIKLIYKGADDVILQHGSLLVKVQSGSFAENIPLSYLKNSNEKVIVNYLPGGKNIFGFSISNKQAFNEDLIIDPMPCLLWGTYLGGSGDEAIGNFEFDSSNNICVVGSSNSYSSIATSGTWQTTIGAGGQDAFIAKYDPDGTTLLWGTYYGGDMFTGAGSVVIDANDDIYITGGTQSTTGISTPGSYQSNSSAGSSIDAFVAKFNSSGTVLIWGTYFGSGGDEGGSRIALDANNNIVISGTTNSTFGIATNGTYQTSNAGGLNDGFIAKFNSTGSALLWATYYGGSQEEQVYDMALDQNGNIYLTGMTYSLNGISTTGAYQTTCGAHEDIFVAKFNSSGTALLSGTYYGGPGYEEAFGIVLDSLSNVFITGRTSSASGMTTTGSFQENFGLPINNRRIGVIAKMNSTLSGLIWASYLGVDNSTTYIWDIALDDGNYVYITGSAFALQGIATLNAYQYSNGGGEDAFVAKIEPDGSSLLWGTYYGAAGIDYGYSIKINALNNVIVTGGTTSTDSIATPGSYQAVFGGGGYDGFIAEFGCTPTAINSIENQNNISIFPNPTSGIFTVNLDNLPGKSEMEVYNLLGEKIYQTELYSNETIINMSHKPKGIYLYTIISEVGNRSSGKFIIQ